MRCWKLSHQHECRVSAARGAHHQPNRLWFWTPAPKRDDHWEYFWVTPVYVICPANAVTGGPEVLHQLVQSINEAGGSAFIVYHPFNVEHKVPAPYVKYNTPLAMRRDIPEGAQVVIPEMWPGMIDRFPGCKINFWWLSVDNFRHLLIHPRIRDAIPALILQPIDNVLAFQAMRRVRRVDRHLYQSEYARLFLEAEGLAPVERLGDYINDDYLQFIEQQPTCPRENIVAYNPMKGRERTAEVLRALHQRVGDHIRPIPIFKMTRADVQDLLARAKVYIDFGHHPGKDRIPREAAAMGTCVLLNRRGSAGNPVDVYVPDFFRVDDGEPGYAEVAADKIVTIVDSFLQYQAQFDDYRCRISAEPAEFRKDAARLFVQ